MVDPLDKIAERLLDEAVKNGELDDYPGKGEPLELEDLSRMSDEVRASYILLKSHGILPEEAELKKELLRLDTLIASCNADTDERDLTQRRSSTAMRLALLLEKRGSTSLLNEFREQLAHFANPNTPR